MRGAQQFDVRNRIDASHRVVTIAVARPVERKWPLQTRIAFVAGSAAALWVAIGVIVYSLI